jgi:bis(5'-adenosyl)-triphosphatase
MSATLKDHMESSPRSQTEKSDKAKEIKFGKFNISPSQVFYKSPTGLTYGLVNLRPIVTGHVLVIPMRIVPKLSDLTGDEYDDLWRSVRIIQTQLEGHYSAGGFNIAVQDGKVAGQSVPHVHVHVLPRVQNDFERNDDIYDELEDWAPTEASRLKKLDGKVELQVPDDEDRRDRTMEEMEMESSAYRVLFD